MVLLLFGNGKDKMPINIMEVLTLILVIFAALSYINNHRKR